jgi:hypothetical protein
MMVVAIEATGFHWRPNIDPGKPPIARQYLSLRQHGAVSRYTCADGWMNI